MTERVIYIAGAAAIVVFAIAAAIYFPPPRQPTCGDGEISIQEKSNGPWYCVTARRLTP